MNDNVLTQIREICSGLGNERTRMMDVVREVQSRFGCVDSSAIDAIAEALGVHRVEVEGVVSFYSFLSTKPKGKVVIRLCNDIIDRMNDSERVASAFANALGIGFGESTADGEITLEHTACIGMCDQAPAALINDTVITELSSDGAKEIVRKLRSGIAPSQLVRKLGDGNNAHELVQSMVKNHLRKAGPVVFAPLTPALDRIHRELKKAFDPDGVFNPGRLYPDL